MKEGSGGGLVVLRLVRLTRIFRAFKSPTLSEPVIVIAQTVQQSTKALYVLLFQLLLLIVISGSLMWLCEQGKWNPATRSYHRKVAQEWNAHTLSWEPTMEESPFQSIPQAFWWAIVTATTVGYGDHFPVTSSGYIVAVVTMSVSLVITALPVGVIGGTFSQVWANLSEQRKMEKAERRSEMEHITKAIQSLDPTRMSKLLFVQVWNNPTHQKGGECGPTSAAQFMGEALLPMPLDSEPLVRQETLRLVDNLDIVKRSIRGHITIRYQWEPNIAPFRDEAAQKKGTIAVTTFDGATVKDAYHGQTIRFEAQEPYCLHGELTVTVLSATGLLNLDGCKRNGISSPYCKVYVYPKAPREEEPVWPQVWRYPTAVQNLSPRWDSAHSFAYDWNSGAGPTPYDGSGFPQQSANTASDKPKLNDGQPGPKNDTAVVSPAPAATSASPDPALPSKTMDEVLGEIEGFHEILQKMREEVLRLDRRLGVPS
jgi:hypothetical protein